LTPDAQILVIGGGLSGMSSALHLPRAGVEDLYVQAIARALGETRDNLPILGRFSPHSRVWYVVGDNGDGQSTLSCIAWLLPRAMGQVGAPAGQPGTGRAHGAGFTS